ncbi:MAG: hypothetical protein E7521_07390 [Ruminococcaceae bacterium]|nr:hypothetical protein [Oscillospiraceae bacterium]
MNKFKRLTLLCGHYGSGKTNVAVNLAFYLKEQYNNVVVADLDIVNPYFRTKDSIDDFKARGIELICSQYANTNVDIPALPANMYRLTADKDITAVIDVGGDDRGAYALGRLVPEIKAENNFDMLMVINGYRPLTPDAESTIEVMREIETACGLKFTGLVNNSNIGEETTAEDIIKSIGYANEVSQASGLPIVMTSVKRELYDGLKNKIDNLLPMTLQAKPV